MVGDTKWVEGRWAAAVAAAAALAAAAAVESRRVWRGCGGGRGRDRAGAQTRTGDYKKRKSVVSTTQLKSTFRPKRTFT